MRIVDMRVCSRCLNFLICFSQTVASNVNDKRNMATGVSSCYDIH